ncbi:MAG: hypothetical protein A2Z13_04430 [Deltaproteobacteria bacterium RBG_16_64_85]|nr:MAG: hypothetical protein A2Z13_04430 [Deltaproteobacteria bacterium RBG_16_64_85]
MSINEEVKRAIGDVARRHGLSLVLLFGSAAAGTARPDSDIDIAVKFRDGNVELRRILEVQRDISALFGDRDVDLAVLNRADPLFMRKIAEQCASLYGEPGEADAFLLLSFRRYQDHRKYLEMERDFAVAYVKRIAS